MADQGWRFEVTRCGEHGIGIGEGPLLEREHPGGVGLIRQLPRDIDPLGILNPGTVLRAVP